MSEQIGIRRACAADLHPILELILDCSHRFILPGLSLQGQENYLITHSVKKMTECLEQFEYFVLEDQRGMLGGVVGIRPLSHLFHLHVRHDLQGQGWGYKLWNVARESALSQARIERFTVNSSRFAVPFYEKMGFVMQGEELRGGVLSFPMILELKK